jgi:hypothetical protein
MRIAVSQAAPMRRLHVKGKLDLYAWSRNGGVGWASGGFLADSIIDDSVGAGSQQQWLSRNSTWPHWSNAVWNMVFVGCENTPQGTFPNPPYTVVDRTPVIREKPYLYVDDRGAYRVFVPALRVGSQGASWANGPTPGDSLPIDRFLVAHPESATSAALNAALAAGKNILFTPGVYSLDQPLRVTRANTILLGLGLPSLIPTEGASILAIDDVGGVKIAGLILDAGPVDSARLLQVGPPGSRADHAANPTFLYDLTVRTGGPAPAKNDVGIEINSNNVVADQIWVWRADHGAGVGWTTNPTKHGLVVNGNDVTVYGLFNEHHCEYQTLWNGNGGRVYMYQSEMPYDVPSQTAWRSGSGGKTDGFASYKVADTVVTHEAWGLGIYCFFRDAPIIAHSAIEAPAVPGVKFHSLTTVWLNGNADSAIAHIIDNAGGTVDGSHSRRVMRQTLAEFP